MNYIKPVRAAAPIDINSSILTPRKWPISYRSVGHIAMVTDIAIILLCGIASGIVYNLSVFGPSDVIPQYFGAAAVVAAFYVSVMKSQELYNASELLSLKSQLGSVTTAWLGVFLFLSGDQFSRGAILSFVASGLALLTTQRIFYRAVLRRGLAGQRFSGRNAVLIADDAAAGEGLVPALLKHGFRLQQPHFLLEDRGAVARDRYFAEIIEKLRGSDVQEIIVCIAPKRWHDIDELLVSFRKLPLPVTLIPVGTASAILQRPSHIMGDSICINLQREPLSTFEQAVKRAIDLAGALTGIFMLLPLFLGAALLIKLDSPGPVFFRQRRSGFNGRHFYIYKFRTMSVLEDGPTITQASSTDARITRVGRFLRRTSIDELPQLFNVVEGTMSLVGPRPHAVAHDDDFDKALSNYALRHHVKPGLTGWAQVKGHRGATPTVAEIRKRVECDLWYIDNWSLYLDFAILLRTVVEVLRARNAY
jgi:Undecaprenyl-phosphate glucose phosphotransferase